MTTISPSSSSSIPSCIDHNSAFFRILTAPYNPSLILPPNPLPIPTIKSNQPNPSSSIVDWSRRPITPESPDSSDEEDLPNDSASSYYHNLHRAIYKPHGKWAWSEGLAIEDPSILTQLGGRFFSSFFFFVFIPGSYPTFFLAGKFCSATIKKGTLGGRPITYISKSSVSSPNPYTFSPVAQTLFTAGKRVSRTCGSAFIQRYATLLQHLNLILLTSL